MFIIFIAHWMDVSSWVAGLTFCVSLKIGWLKIVRFLCLKEEIMRYYRRGYLKDSQVTWNSRTHPKIEILQNLKQFSFYTVLENESAFTDSLLEGKDKTRYRHSGQLERYLGSHEITWYWIIWSFIYTGKVCQYKHFHFLTLCKQRTAGGSVKFRFLV